MLGFAESAEGWQAIILKLRAELAIRAGADKGLIPQWLDVGRQRANIGRRVPGR